MTAGSGAIVLAAYDPDPTLFAAQIRSIIAQTVTEWECIISVDGDAQTVTTVLADVAEGDTRFRVIADGTRLGFYLNFERGLSAVLHDSAWVALSDQDDHWYPEKLATLLPHLADVSLIAGQARLVEHPGDQVIGTTDRRDVDQEMIALNNQFTGSLMAFRRELLDVAIPFPRANTRAAAHDHWIAVVAGAADGTRVIDTVVQDYVQHANNVFGDPSRGVRAGLLTRLSGPVRSAIDFTRRYEGSATPAAMVRMLFWIYVGWRQLMVETLSDRVGRERIEPLIAGFSKDRSFRAIRTSLDQGRTNGTIPAAFVKPYLASWAAGLLVSGRRRASPHSM